MLILHYLKLILILYGASTFVTERRKKNFFEFEWVYWLFLDERREFDIWIHHEIEPVPKLTSFGKWEFFFDIWCEKKKIVH
jgi:hypothetical protein